MNKKICLYDSADSYECPELSCFDYRSESGFAASFESEGDLEDPNTGNEQPW